MTTIEFSAANVTFTVMLVLSIFFSIIIAVAALVGFFRRWKRSTVSLCRIILAVILAALIVFAIGGAVDFNESFAELVSNELPFNSDALSQTVILLLVSAVYAIVIPFAFVFVFVIVAQLLRIPAYFISKALHINQKDATENQKAPEDTNDPVETTEEFSEAPVASTTESVSPTKNKSKKILEQIGGALISAVYALVVISVLILPISSAFCILSDGLTMISDSAKDSEAPINVGKSPLNGMVIDNQTVIDDEGVVNAAALNTVMTTTFAPIRNNFFISASYSAPMRFIYGKITTVKINGTPVSFGNEVRNTFDIMSSAMCFDTDFENYGEKQIEASDKIASYIASSDFYCELAAEVISSIAKTVEKPSDNELLSALISTFEQTDKESVADDITTLRDIFKSAIRNNIPKAVSEAASKEDGYLDLFESINGDFLYDVLSAVKKNEDFSGLVSPALQYASEAITKSLGAEPSTMSVGIDLRDLSEEQLKEESKNLSEALSNLKEVVSSFNELNNTQNISPEEILSVDFAPLGAFIDNLRDSLLIGDCSKELLLVILRSDTLSGNGLDEIFDVVAEHVERGEKVSMEKVLVSTKEILKVLDDYKSGNKNTEELSVALKSIIDNLDPETAAITKEIIPKANTEIVGDNDNTNKKATENLMTSFVEALSSEEAKEISEDEEAFNKEVAAFDSILNMINSGANLTPEEIEEIVVTVASSKIVTSALVSTAYDENGNLTQDAQLLKDGMTNEDKQIVVLACKDYYDSHKNDYSASELAEMKSNLAAVASIFDENIARAIAGWH